MVLFVDSGSSELLRLSRIESGSGTGTDPVMLSVCVAVVETDDEMVGKV
jgi:hypothetical protein